MFSSVEVREKFLNFFEKNGHKIINSSSLVPEEDPSLLFTNAGMNQFKNLFLNPELSPMKKAVSVQRCLRAGGKHNDLEQVGFSPRHHTFFEMLGNFSFGDYFKKEAIHYAWTFLVDELHLKPELLHISVFRDDEEAYELWKELGIPSDHLHRRGEKDNFWEMGAVGPCGPCSEIFYDYGPSYSDGKNTFLDDESRYIEIWNLVFIQYERLSSGELIPLKYKSIDTGAGLERLCAVLQNTYTNYKTDLFLPLKNILEKKVTQAKESSLNVVIDHLRAASFLISDGILPGSENRSYVLRRILRRAIRHLELMGRQNPLLHELVRPLFDLFEGFYPENEKKIALIEETLKEEELKFRKTLKQGLNLIENLTQENLTGEKIFELYDTYGMPSDLIAILLQEKNLPFLKKEFEQELEKQKERSRAHQKFQAKNLTEINLSSFPKTKIAPLTTKELTTSIIHQEKNSYIFEQTLFFPTLGGQYHDTGSIITPEGEFEVLEVIKQQDHYWHVLSTDQKLSSPATLYLNEKRRFHTSQHHSATHLLQQALRTLLGKKIEQAGSSVQENKLRFDFTYHQPLSKELIKEIEHFVQEKIFENHQVEIYYTTKNQALKQGALAFFGDKYPDEVRVVKIGESLELCGGTHVQSSLELLGFHLLTENSIASGVRRIEAVTGESFFLEINKIKDSHKKIYEHLQGESPLQKILTLEKNLQDLSKKKDTYLEELFQYKLKESSELFILVREEELVFSKNYPHNKIFFTSIGSFSITGNVDFLKKCNLLLKNLSIKGGGKNHLQGKASPEQLKALKKALI